MALRQHTHMAGRWVCVCVCVGVDMRAATQTDHPATDIYKERDSYICYTLLLSPLLSPRLSHAPLLPPKKKTLTERRMYCIPHTDTNPQTHIHPSTDTHINLPRSLIAMYRWLPRPGRTSIHTVSRISVLEYLSITSRPCRAWRRVASSRGLSGNPARATPSRDC